MRHTDFNKALYDTEIHMYGLNQLLNSPKHTWEGRDNIDRQDMAVILSTMNTSGRFSALDILLALTPIFQRRAYKAVVDWLPSDFGDTESWNTAEAEGIRITQFLVHLLSEWYMVHDYSPDTPKCPCNITVTFKDPKRNAEWKFLTVEDYVRYMTDQRDWFRTERTRIEMGEDGILGKVDYDSHDSKKHNFAETRI